MNWTMSFCTGATLFGRFVCWLFGHSPFQETSYMGYCLRCQRVFTGTKPD